MKKIITLLVLSAATLLMFTGCAQSNNYTQKEQGVIDFVNKAVKDQYNQTVSKEDFSYDIGKQISENEFVALESDEKSEDEYKDIVSVVALIKGRPEKGKIMSFNVRYNEKTKNIIDINAKTM